AREFELLGAAHVNLPFDFDARTPEEQNATLDSLVSSRLSSVSRAVQAKVNAVVSEASNGVTGEDAPYFTYFRRQPASVETVRLLGDGRAQFDFELELVGSWYLMSVVAPETGSATRMFTVDVSDYGGTNAETIPVEIRGSSSRDAFPRYDALFADGVFDIAVHFGGDYNTDRFDLSTARWLVETLLEGGWENASVSSFETLTIDSPPFTRKVLVEGREIEVGVHIFHSDMVEATEEARLSDAMKTSLAERDVVIYSGHAGEGAGFILDYQPRHEISASQFATLELASKYQIYVLDGCRTYRTYVDDLMKNPGKTFENLDIVTTVNTTPFSVGYQVLWEFLYWFTLTDDAGNHYPLTWMTLLRGVNTEQFSGVHYGVHGVDDNPQLNPHASEGVACTPCKDDTDCRAGGNLCLAYSGGAACGVACTTDAACPEGYRCARIGDPDALFYIPKQCVRRDYICP
ncbi:MAG: hypothetical protein RBU30_25440, partial [Polyangia bacterium]|nr:hypothetical protein [Polyangia bacterium]